MGDLQVQALARRLRALEKQALQRKQPTLGFSSLDGGALQVADDDDVLTMIVGQQFDGTNTAAVVTGPTPPTPIVPFVTGQPGALRVYWDGTFTDSLVAPMDFARVLAYAVPLGDLGTPDPLDQAHMVGQFTSATGGELSASLDPGVEYGVFLVTWTQAGKYGAASDVALATVGTLADAAEVAEKSSVYRGTAPPWADGAPDHVDDIGDLWFDTTPLPGLAAVITAYEVTSGVATLTIESGPDFQVGSMVQVSGVTAGLDGSRTITGITPATDVAPASVTFATAEADTGAIDISAQDPHATIQGTAEHPSNRPSMWNGTAWVDLRDSGISDIATLVNSTAVQVATNSEGLIQTQEQIATLAVTATDAYNAAYAADGRIAISDYEPTAQDVAGKNDGSLWITRTRDRLNECINPSFEVSTAGWSTYQATLARQAASVAGDGAWAGRMTNSGAAGLHYAYNATPLTVTAGESLIISAYLRSISGSKDDYFVFINWHDSGNVLIGQSVGTAIDLLTEADDPEGFGWQRAYVAGQAPDNTAYAHVGISSSTAGASAVWEFDAALFERSLRLGRYFDGGSEGGSWIGTPDLSASDLDGGAIIRLFNLEDGSWAEKFWTADTISSVSASTIDRGEMDGGFLKDNSVPIDKAFMPNVVAFEALFAGAIVNVFNSGGIPMVRLAKATGVGYDATGFVLTAANAGDQPVVYTTGYNPLMLDLSAGMQFLSTTPGKCSSTPPQDVGTIVQRVGSAVSDTTIDFAALTSVALT